MDNGQAPDTVEPHKDKEEGNSLDWLHGNNRPEVILAPMDSISLFGQDTGSFDNTCGETFTRKRVFEAASQGDATQLSGLLDYLRVTDKRLTSPEFTDETNGKTALMKALLNLKHGKNDTIEVLLDIAEKTGDLEHFINASYKDPVYKGQTALHISIERRSFDHVKLLVQKGADVQAKANGTFFQDKAGLGFYFGELPLSLAACTNQPNVVSFLMDNPHRRADLIGKDSQGNTVLHTLVVLADNTTENTDMIAKMYDEILIQHKKLEKKVQLEAIENNKGLTPLKLAAKLGKIGLFRHMLHREFKDEQMSPLSRKFTEWVYGPVHSSFYDMSSIDTNENNSVLEILIFGGDIPNRPEMLQIEPVCSLLKHKWDMFASKLFLMNFLFYLMYLIIFTAVAFNRKEGKPPFPIEDFPSDYLLCTGEIISVLGAVWFLYKAITFFKRNPPNFNTLYTDGVTEILFFLQATLLLLGTILYMCGRREYISLLVLSLALAWINVLYYSRGSKQMGLYSVMMQRMILGDLFNFLCVYGVMLFGFSAAIITLMDGSSPAHEKHSNCTQGHGGSSGVEPFEGKKSSYRDLSFTTLEMFKITIGMGDLEFTEHIKHKEVFYILLILYVVLTYILLLNMLIALMGNTVERISQENENIWNLQRAFTILDIERTLPRCMTSQLESRVLKVVCFRRMQDDNRRFLRVEEMNWKQWSADLGVTREEDPGESMMKPKPLQTPGGLWNINPFLERIHVRRRQAQHSSII